MGLRFAIISQNQEENRVLLGDHVDDDEYHCDLKGPGIHFITIVVTAEDVPVTFKNLIVRTGIKGNMVALEHDSRRWGAPENAPNPYERSNAVTF